jgi:hypothetical protein
MDRLALAVVCADSLKPDAKLLTVLIGTDKDQKVTAGVISGSDPEKVEGFWPIEKNTSREYQTEDGNGNTPLPIFDGKNKTVVFDRVIRVFIFDTVGASIAELSEIQSPESPLATALTSHANKVAIRLDTAGFVVSLDAEGADGVAPTGVWAVSRLKIVATNSLPDLTGGEVTFPISSFELVAHIPLAVSTNGTTGTNQARVKRFDSRAIINFNWESTRKLFLGANPRGPNLTTTIKLTDGEAGVTEACSIRGDLTKLAPKVANSNARLIITETENKGVLDAGFLASYDPERRGHAFWKTKFEASNSTSPVTREVGFRLLRAQENEAMRIGLRAELRIIALSNLKRIEGVSALLAPAVGKAVASKLSDAWAGREILLAQEQLLDTIRLTGTDEDPFALTQWLATVRFGNADSGDIGKFTSTIVGEFAGKAEKDSIVTAVKRVRPETGASFLREVVSAPTETYWHIVGTLSEYPYRRRTIPSDVMSEVTANVDKLAHDPRRIVAMTSFQPRITVDLWDPKGTERAHSVTFDQPFPKLENNQPVFASNQVWDVRPSRALHTSTPAWQPDRSVRGINFQLETTVKSTEQSLRIGAMGVTPGKAPSANYGVTTKITVPPQDDTPVFGLFAHIVSTCIPVRSFGFVAEDAVSTQQRDSENNPSLLLAFNKPKTGDFKLQVEEQFGGDRDQSIVFNLIAKQSSAKGDKPESSQRVLLIDGGLFRVTEVTIGDLTNRGDSGEATIATYGKADDGVSAWKLLAADPVVRLRLPPQTIGEAMEKRAGSGPAASADISPNDRVDFRIGSPTVLNVDPTVRDRRTFEAPVNVRRMFNQTEDALPGPFVRDLRFEMAYGLVTSLRGDGEIRIAELGGIYGRAPEALPYVEDREISILRQYARTLLKAEKRRLAVDKLWSGSPEAPFVTTNQLQFHLKTSPEKFPGSKKDPRFQLPVVGQADGVLEATFVSRLEKNDDSGDFAGVGFTGGVPWAFESLNILREVYETPFSTTGRVSGIHLSALGGWGGQRAVFATGKTIIETETDMGRLSHYKLERIGRIGGLHNRAKHVIVYKRTTVPSAQFFNRDNRIGKTQDDLAGRPILRKFEEYVEILQPERWYPEDGVSVRESGCMAGSRFVSTRIPVDSSWGGDVGTQGWAVPLWRKDMAKAPGSKGRDASDIYPKPVIALLNYGEAETLVACEVDNPETLQFFTSTRKGDTGEKVDLWPSVAQIDYCDRPVTPAGSWPSNDLQQNTIGDAMLSGPDRVPAGFAKLTLLLKDGGQASRIAAGRIDAGPAVVLKSMTISRSAPVVVTTTEAPAAKAAKLGRDIAKSSADVRAEVDRLLASLPNELDRAIRSLRLDSVDDLKTRAKASVNRSCDRLITEIEQIYNRLSEEIDKVVTDANSLAFSATNMADRLLQPIDERVYGVLLRLAAQFELLFGDLKAQLGEIATVKAKLENAEKSIESIENQSLAQLQASNDDLVKQLDDARVKLELLTGNIKSSIGNLKDRLAAGFGVPIGSARKLLQDLRLEQLQSLTDWLSEQTAQAVSFQSDIAAWELPTGDVEGFKQKVADQLDSLLAYLEIAEGELDRPIRQIEALHARKDIPAKVKDILKGLKDTLVRVKAELPSKTNVKEKIQEVADWDVRAVTEEQVNALRKALLVEVDPLIAAFKGLSGNLLGVVALVDSAALDVDRHLFAFEAILREKIAATELYLHEQLEKVVGAYKALFDSLKKQVLKTEPDGVLYKAIAANIKAIIDLIQSSVDELEKEANASVLSLQGTINKSLTDRNHKTGIAGQWNLVIADSKTRLAGQLRPWLPSVESLQDDMRHALLNADSRAVDIKASISELINTQRNIALKAIEDLDTTSLESAIQNARKTIEKQFGSMARDIGSRIEGTLANASELADQASTALQRGQDIHQQADGVLRLFRAVGDPPKTDGLGFNRPEVAYVLDATRDIIDLTPGIALVNRVNDTAQAAQQAGQAANELLEGLGVRLPVCGILDEYLPANLKDVSISKLFPKMAGLDLEGLFAKVGFPSLDGSQSNQGFKITRGFDVQAREAWLKAEVDVRLGTAAEVFTFGPVGLHLDNGRFKASARIARKQDGTIEKVGGGRIDGDWRLMTAGLEIVTFESTPLIFNEAGRLNFPVSADKIRMAPTLRFLSDLSAKIQAQLPPWLEIIEQNGLPIGIQSCFTAGPFDLSAGTFSVTNFSLAARFGLVVAPRFEITSGFDVASPDAPFTLRVWILTGGGYIRQRLRYLPSERVGGLIDYSLEVAITAGVGVDFNFGVVRGAVQLCLGCSITLFQSNAGGNATALTAFILAYGHADLAGIVSANITLRLAITYDGSVMKATGTLRMSFRISVFYTLRVRQQAQYKIAGQERKKPAESSNYADEFA